MHETLNIEPFKEDNLTPNGYDLTIAEVSIPDKDIKVTEGKAVIPPKTWFAVSTLEVIRLGARYSGSLWIRTSFARRGVISSFGKIDAGFEGTLTLSAYNGSEKEVELDIGNTFAQIVVHELKSMPRSLYESRSGHYQGQRGVTLDRINDGTG